MKIAIPTSDRVKIDKRTGRATEFAICELVDGSYEFVEFRTNPHEHNHSEGEEHSHNKVVDKLKDCDALLVAHVGTHFKTGFDALEMPIYRTEEEELKEAISRFSADILSHERL